METEKIINFLPKPNINYDKASIWNNKKKVYANLFEIKLTKEIKLYQYPYKVTPEIEDGDTRIREKLFKTMFRKIRADFGQCFISGNLLYSMKKVEEVKTYNCFLYLSGKTEYVMEINKYEQEKLIREQDIHKDPLAKQCIELIIRDILQANPKLEFYKNVFVNTKKKQKIQTDRVSITFYPGFVTSFMETDKGNYLNVTLRSKIIQNESVLDFIHQFKNLGNKETQNSIRDELSTRSFKVIYAKRNYKISDILFDVNPSTQTFNYQGRTINLIKYYEEAHKLKIKDPNQPLILVKNTDSQGNQNNLYFVPEFCRLSGLEDDATKDGYFMRELAKYTKLEPKVRVQETNEFIKLLQDDEKANEESLSSKEKSEYYGIQISPLNELFDAYYMNETKLVGGNNRSIQPTDKKFPILKKKDMVNWLCFYEKSNYDDAESLYKNLEKASKAYGLKIGDPEWVEMQNKSSPTDWKETADEYFGPGKEREFDFVVFLLGKNDNKLYPELKKHSLCTSGYVSQVVKARSMQKKGVLSVCSKILLQLNAKLRGVSYKVNFDNSVKDRKLMVVGVDSSRIKGKKTGIAMVATINDTFTDFYNKEDIIKEENYKEQLQYCVSSFIEEAVEVYKKQNKNEKPKGIIIYRQGVSLQQKDYLKDEIREIDNLCENKNILYYYILVNTKTTFKFFEKNAQNKYSNPGPGLLIINGVTNRNFFEFYIQPQEVTEGSATPTCFHVAYGNLNFPEFIPKFTYDLCHIYSNWQGTVRVPNVLKCAEKLSKMTVKYMKGELNKNLLIGQAYL
jgi:aubergine-like protein